MGSTINGPILSELKSSVWNYIQSTDEHKLSCMYGNFLALKDFSTEFPDEVWTWA
jgi:hypothetical protein